MVRSSGRRSTDSRLAVAAAHLPPNWGSSRSMRVPQSPTVNLFECIRRSHTTFRLPQNDVCKGDHFDLSDTWNMSDIVQTGRALLLKMADHGAFTKRYRTAARRRRNLPALPVSRSSTGIGRSPEPGRSMLSMQGDVCSLSQHAYGQLVVATRSPTDFLMASVSLSLSPWAIVCRSHSAARRLCPQHEPSRSCPSSPSRPSGRHGFRQLEQQNVRVSAADWTDVPPSL